MTSSHSSPTPSRRTVSKGLAWSAPVIASAVAAPVMAVSPGWEQVTDTITANKWNAATVCWDLPANARQIEYEVIGGGGATGGTKQWGETGGHGALVAGQLGTPGVALKLWAVAGGGGPNTTPYSGARFATGFGNGGPSTPIPVPGFVLGQASQTWAAGGGAGSALALNNAPNVGGSLVAAAGGGGAGASSGNSFDTLYQAVQSSSGGNGGNAPGGNGAPFRAVHRSAELTGGGGSAATGSVGGAGATAASSTTPTDNLDYKETWAGNPGGNAGTGNFGGGNGADPVQHSYGSTLTHYYEIASAGGGGGYAGGGSGGVILIDRQPLVGANLQRAVAGVGGAGGAGSSYVNPSPGSGVTNQAAPVVSSSNGGTRSSTAGKPGSVTIRFWVPAAEKQSNYRGSC